LTPSARLTAAIEILDDIAARRRPANDVLKDWGLSHRFAGSGDRAGISALVHDALRRRASAGYIMGNETSRAILLGTLKLSRGLDVGAISALCDGSRFAPQPLSDSERQALASWTLDGAPAWVAGDYPEWLDSEFQAAFGESRVDELSALASRAPVDIRVNTLKVERESVLAQLSHMNVKTADFSPVGLRVLPLEDGRAVSVQSEPAFQKGAYEIQDEGSQLAAQLAAPDPGMQIIDLCAGGGGKTLALAALMDNRGQIFATDSDKRRLAPIFDRMTRAGVRNVQVRSPKGKEDEPLEGLEGHIDLVVVDAPCTGTGTWRRNPDAKWRVRPNALDDRIKEQAEVLDRASHYVKSGGRIAYITCSLLPRENDGAIISFLDRHSGFEVIEPANIAEHAGLEALASFVSPKGLGLQLTPKRTGTDGFYISVLSKMA
jgi:16S rRNA (cytosine967-C5)-methyltransferase